MDFRFELVDLSNKCRYLEEGFLILLGGITKGVRYPSLEQTQPSYGTIIKIPNVIVQPERHVDAPIPSLNTLDRISGMRESCRNIQNITLFHHHVQEEFAPLLAELVKRIIIVTLTPCESLNVRFLGWVGRGEDAPVLLPLSLYNDDILLVGMGGGGSCSSAPSNVEVATYSGSSTTHTILGRQGGRSYSFRDVSTGTVENNGTLLQACLNLVEGKLGVLERLAPYRTDGTHFPPLVPVSGTLTGVKEVSANSILKVGCSECQVRGTLGVYWLHTPNTL
mmetsp:Transcript_23964/g.49966  ORF Transcript_23964/g.49966 Transcript_23964/m.49966 type:complete len:279 (-) Transcript_23964:275-1111(-)